MALIGMAVHCTEENGRAQYLARCLESLRTTVDWSRHRMVAMDSASCAEAAGLLDAAVKAGVPLEILRSAEARGTAWCVNRCWERRRPQEKVIKVDDDVVFQEAGWLDLMEEALDREPKLGILGLKRVDVQCPPHLRMLAHSRGQRWIVVEDCVHIVGTASMFSSALLEVIGGLWQCGWRYGFDDTLASVRCALAGFQQAYLPQVRIEHPDPGSGSYGAWKQRYAGEHIGGGGLAQAIEGLRSGTLPLRQTD